MPPNPERIQVKDCQGLFEWIWSLWAKEPYGWLFRGQHNAEWGLRPSIERGSKLLHVLPTELATYNEFRAKVGSYTQHVPAPDDIASWLAMMQHHGIPTRLLDWSYSPFVALFFALQPLPKEDCECVGRLSSLWCIDNAVVCREARRIAKEFNIPGDVNFSHSENLQKLAFPPAWADSENGLVVPILPRTHVARLSAQQSILLMNCNYQLGFEDSLGRMLQGQSAWLRKVEFPSSLTA